jgi:hypothetical protein
VRAIENRRSDTAHFSQITFSPSGPEDKLKRGEMVASFPLSRRTWGRITTLDGTGKACLSQYEVPGSRHITNISWLIVAVRWKAASPEHEISALFPHH